MRTKPSDYPALPFHGIRIANFISSLVVGVILAVFIYHLHADGYKLPFAFLILLIAALISLIAITLSAFMNCSCGLNTVLSMALSTLCLVVWVIGLGVMGYNTAHTILTSCSTQYWGNSTGESVCRMYKAVFAFTILATAGFLASIVLDAVVRNRQHRFGKYGLAGPTEDNMELKMSRNQSESGIAYASVPAPAMSGGYPNTSYSHSLEHSHASEAQQYYDSAPGNARAERVPLADYDHGGYNQPTGYDPIMHR